MYQQPFKNLIPQLTHAEYEALEKSLTEEGLRENIILWGNVIVDGHNRYEICIKNNIPVRITQMKFDSENDAKLWLIDNQLSRRNITLAQRIGLVEAAQAIKELKDKGKEQQGTRTDLLSPSDKRLKPINTQAEVAEQAGVSTGTVAAYDFVQEHGDKETQDKMTIGEISIKQSYQQTRKRKKVQAVEQKVKENSQKPSEGVDIFKTNKKYNIIYADPPWEHWMGGYKNATNHYKTMPIEEICKLPVSNIADKDCILFLWVTFPILEDAFGVIKAWGFKYSTCGFVWMKKNKNGSNFFGLGNWTRANEELCLIAVKGHTERLRTDISQIIESPVEEHSKKPDIVREKIVQLVGELPRIELFARQKKEGWDHWGNEL